MYLSDGLASVLVELEHEQVPFMLFVPDESVFLLPEALVPLSQACGGARGGRMPRFASEAMRDFFLYRRFSHTIMMTSMRRGAH